MNDLYYVYIITNRKLGALYTGLTNDLAHGIEEHRSEEQKSFASRYRLRRLVWYDSTTDVCAAISRERQIKGWLRSKKIALIEAMNPEWEDLAATL